jgi:hypothetical protein
MKTDKKPFAIYTEAIIDNGQRPFIKWAVSAKSLARDWFRKYGISAAKIVPCIWNMETGEYEPEVTK